MTSTGGKNPVKKVPKRSRSLRGPIRNEIGGQKEN